MALLGNPFVGNASKQMTTDELIQALRVDIAGELEAIIVYEAHIMATDDERLRRFSVISRMRRNSMWENFSSSLLSCAPRKGSRLIRAGRP